MIFKSTPLPGAYVVEIEPIEDERGFFARGWCRREFEKNGLNPELLQINFAFSRRKGTLRGLHFQRPPHAEAKLIRCTRGAIYDVIIDLRRGSPTFRRWLGVELTSDNRRMLYVPEGFAQGYQTLVDDTEIYYHTSQFYNPEAASGVRWNDPAFAVDWPLPVTTISTADSSWPDFSV